METNKRTALKSITYRVIVTVILGIISWFYTGNFFQTSAITIVYAISATVVYYVHEKVWFRVIWGRKHPSKK